MLPAMVSVEAERLVVHNPMGYPPKVPSKPLAPRLDTLDGKTVFLVDCRFDDADLLLQQLQRWFAENLPTVQTELVQLSNVYTKDDPQLWQRIKSQGHAAIVGVGH
jgi:hypothetical protein